MFGREYAGDIAEIGEQVWYRITGRTETGRGKYEARFETGVWVGKSEMGDTHVVVDVQRGLMKTRTVRRMPEEFRWNKDLLKSIQVQPYRQVTGSASAGVSRSMYITERMIGSRGPTSECMKC